MKNNYTIEKITNCADSFESDENLKQYNKNFLLKAKNNMLKKIIFSLLNKNNKS